MKMITTALAATCLTLGVLSTATAEQNTGVNVGAELPPNIRALLIEEMLGIDEASKKIHSALVQGQHEIVAEQAQKIHDSFIMDQQMTEEDKQILHDTVPEGFLALDQSFHKLSSDLADAARQEDTGAQLEQFSKLTESCVGCHNQYATERFPGL